MTQRDYSKVFTLGEVARALYVEDWRIRNFVTGKDYGPIRPSVAVGRGPGSRRLFNMIDIYKLALANKLYEDGVQPRYVKGYVGTVFDPLHPELLEYGRGRVRKLAGKKCTPTLELQKQIFVAGRQFGDKARCLIVLFPIPVMHIHFAAEVFTSTPEGIPPKLVFIRPRADLHSHSEIARRSLSSSCYVLPLDELFEAVDIRLLDEQALSVKDQATRKRRVTRKQGKK